MSEVSDIFGSFSTTVAVYKGLTVAVCTVNKAEVNLTRQDLIELINVCSIFVLCNYLTLCLLYKLLKLSLTAC